MNAIPKRDIDGTFYECGIDQQWFDQKGDADKCCASVVNQSDIAEGRVANKRSKQQDEQLSVPGNDVLYGRNYLGGLR